jgi:hypothetical protein
MEEVASEPADAEPKNSVLKSSELRNPESKI